MDHGGAHEVIHWVAAVVLVIGGAAAVALSGVARRRATPIVAAVPASGSGRGPARPPAIPAPVERSMAWILAILGCGLRWLEHDNVALRYLGPAALAIYILHQVPIATIGTIVVTWHTSVALKVLIITSGSFIATMAIYEWLIRRNRLLRVMFGLKAGDRPAFETRESRERSIA